MSENRKNQLLLTAVLGALSLIILAVVLYIYDPLTAPAYVFAVFYISAAGTLICLFTLIFYALRSGSVQLLHYERMRVSLREASLLAILVLGSLALSSKGLLYWWIELVFMAAVLLTEIYFLI